jgi:hypothetical protein
MGTVGHAHLLLVVGLHKLHSVFTSQHSSGVPLA